MNKMKKEKRQYPDNFKTSFGFSTMTFPTAASTILITSFFMLYLTDYSGIDQAIGNIGYAAAFGTILLLIARIVDIVNDPVQAWIVDNAKEGRLGKYRKFAFANIFMVSISVICIFSIPMFVKSSVWLLPVWAGLFYLLYEFGVAFNTSMPLLQKTSYDTRLRTKWTLLMRIWIIVILVPVYFYIPVVTIVDQGIGNIGQSFSLVAVVIMLILGVFAFFGVLGMKEKPDTMETGESAEENLKIRDVARMFKKNKPLMVHSGAMFASNIVFGLTSAIAVYFLKWYYSADITTGVVDDIRYAELYGIYAASGLIPNFISPFLAPKLIKKVGTYMRAVSLCLIIAIVVYIGMTSAFYTGALLLSPYIFIIINFFSGMALGTAVIPQMLLWTECADYAEYTTGRKMSALVNSLSNMLGKAQAALSTVLVGGILIVVGYSVDSSTGNYAGNVEGLPGMIGGFGIFMTIVPVVVMLIALLLYKFLYPITPELQKEMIETLAARREEK